MAQSTARGHGINTMQRMSTFFHERASMPDMSGFIEPKAKPVSDSAMASKRAALNVMNDPWWNCDYGDKEKACYLVDDRDKIANTVCKNYGVSRADIYSHVKGTVIVKTWDWCLIYCSIGLLVAVIYHATTDDDCPTNESVPDSLGEYKINEDVSSLIYNYTGTDDLKCRPMWFNEQFSSLAHSYDKVAQLGELVLALFVGLAYKRYQQYYWETRKIQGSVNNIALCVGSMVDVENKSPVSIELQRTFERYLCLIQILTYMNVSPLIQAKVSMADLESRVIGIDQLVTAEELAILQYTKTEGKSDKPADGQVLPGSAGNGPMNTILVWLQMTFDQMLEEKVIGNKMSEARVTSYCCRFQEHLMTLRGTMATFVFLKQFPTPLAYAHMLQILVDSICIMCPFALVYEIDTLVIKNAGWDDHDKWATMPLTVAAIFFTTFFFQGLLSLAKALNSPFGHKVDEKTGMLVDQEFMLNVKQVLKQTRMGQYSLMNSSIAAPAICQGQ